MTVHSTFNSLLKDKILDWFKLKAFADKKIKVPKMMFVFDRVENMVGKGENAGYPQCFQSAFWIRVIKSLDCVVNS